MKNFLSILLLSLLAIPNFCDAQTWNQKGTSLDGEADWIYSSRSVDISADGNVIATGSISNEGTEDFTGYVKVYEWLSDTWTQRGNDIYTGSLSGVSAVSLSSDGNTVAISGSTDVEGHNYSVFSWDGSSWTQKGLSLGIYGEEGQPEQGWVGGPINLSSDGNILAIGAPTLVTEISLDGNFDYVTGLTKVFLWTDGAWAQMGNDIMDIPASAEVNIASNNGNSISLSADGLTIAIGSPAILNTQAPYFGSCRMYEWSGSNWLQKGNTINGLMDHDRFGWSVSLSSDGNTVAVGAPLNVGSGQFEGSVRVFSWTGSTWNLMGNSISGEIGFDESGWSVSLSSDGNTLAIGGPNNNNGNGTNAGHVRIYQWNESSWLQSGNDIDGQTNGNAEGYAVNMSSDGHSVIMGTRENPELDGVTLRHVRVFSDISLGVNEKNSDIELSVYPNPSNGIFTIESKNIDHFTVTNIDGKVIKEANVKGNKSIIDLSEQAKGVYFLTLTTKQGVQAKKLVIQ